jgi:N-acetylmuramoyl-L-alanine amidase
VASSKTGDDGTSSRANKAVAQAMASTAGGSSDPSSADDGVRDLHRVERGENLRSIARQYGVSVDALKNANSINSDTSVHAGMVLTIPAS